MISQDNPQQWQLTRRDATNAAILSFAGAFALSNSLEAKIAIPKFIQPPTPQPIDACYLMDNFPEEIEGAARIIPHFQEDAKIVLLHILQEHAGPDGSDPIVMNCQKDIIKIVNDLTQKLVKPTIYAECATPETALKWNHYKERWHNDKPKREKELTEARKNFAVAQATHPIPRFLKRWRIHPDVYEAEDRYFAAKKTAKRKEPDYDAILRKYGALRCGAARGDWIILGPETERYVEYHIQYQEKYKWSRPWVKRASHTYTDEEKQIIEWRNDTIVSYIGKTSSPLAVQGLGTNHCLANKESCGKDFFAKTPKSKSRLFTEDHIHKYNQAHPNRKICLVEIVPYTLRNILT